MEHGKHLIPGKVVDLVTQQYREIQQSSQTCNTMYFDSKKSKKKEKELQIAFIYLQD